MPGNAEGPDASRATLNAMIEGLHELGYTEGQNVVFERRFGGSTRIDSARSLLNWSNARSMSLWLRVRWLPVQPSKRPAKFPSLE